MTEHAAQKAEISPLGKRIGLLTQEELEELQHGLVLHQYLTLSNQKFNATGMEYWPAKDDFLRPFSEVFDTDKPKVKMLCKNIKTLAELQGIDGEILANITWLQDHEVNGMINCESGGTYAIKDGVLITAILCAFTPYSWEDLFEKDIATEIENKIRSTIFEEVF